MSRHKSEPQQVTRCPALVTVSGQAVPCIKRLDHIFGYFVASGDEE